jgi:cyclohexanecarboxylate-CoA ligase
VLCIQLPNWTEAVIYTYAASRLGAIACPITTIYLQRELTFILKGTKYSVVVPSVYRGFDYASMVCELANDLPRTLHPQRRIPYPLGRTQPATPHHRHQNESSTPSLET